MLTRVYEVYLIMKNWSINNTILCITVLAFFLICGSISFYGENYTPESQTAMSASAESDQYIPENLDYTEVINEVKKEEGIPVTENKSKKLSDNNLSDGVSISENLSVEDAISQANVEMSEATDVIADESLRLYHFRQANELYKHALKKDEENLEALIGAGLSATFIGKKSEAKNVLMRAYATYPENPDVHKALGDYSFKFSEYNNAIEYYNLSLLSGNLKDYGTNIATAVCYEKLGDIDSAIAYYRVSLQLNPDSELAQSRLAYFEELRDSGYYPDSRIQEAENEPSKTLSDEEIEKIIIKTHKYK